MLYQIIYIMLFLKPTVTYIGLKKFIFPAFILTFWIIFLPVVPMTGSGSDANFGIQLS